MARYPDSSRGNDTNPYLRCISQTCLTTYPIDRLIYTCPRCGDLLDVAYDFKLPLPVEQMKGLFLTRRSNALVVERSGVWRFRELLPFMRKIDDVVSLAEGDTPLYAAPRCAQYAGLSRLQFKHLGLNPTGSFKDYGMTTGVTQARALGATAVACASTGNTSASMAAYAARANLRAFVFIPADQVALGKLSQSLEYGATVVEIEGNFDDAMRLVRELASETGVYLLNSVNPFRLEGQKTITFELLEQLDWEPPDWIVLPGGNLGNASAIGKGLQELLDLGFISRLPRMAVIQAAGAAPFYNLLSASKRDEIDPIASPSTLATAIRIGNPISWKKARRALKLTNGVVERVSEEEIADSKAMIGQDGIGCEPASAAALAGITRLAESGMIGRHDRVIGILTGNLLKDPAYTIDYHSDHLFQEVAGNREKVAVRFANRAIRVGTDKNQIKRALNL